MKKTVVTSAVMSLLLMLGAASTGSANAQTTKKKPTATKKRLPNHKGGAPIGNKFWMMRSSHGRKPTFDSPSKLEAACHEYFAWCDKHPFKGDIPRPMTMDAARPRRCTSRCTSTRTATASS